MTYAVTPSSLLIGNSFSLFMREAGNSYLSIENNSNLQNTERKRSEQFFIGYSSLGYLLGSSLTIHQRIFAGFGVIIGTGLVAAAGYKLGNGLKADPTKSAVGGAIVGNIALSYFFKISPWITYSLIGAPILWYATVCFVNLVPLYPKLS